MIFDWLKLRVKRGVLGLIGLVLATWRAQHNRTNQRTLSHVQQKKKMLSLLLASAAAQNPFSTYPVWYVNPSYQTSLNSTMQNLDPFHPTEGPIYRTMEAMYDEPSAYWIDVKAKVNGAVGGTDSVSGILADAASMNPIPLIELIVYDLPNRDCNARASNGEICCTYLPDGRCDYSAGGQCESGLNEYRSEYIDPFVAAIREYPQVPVVLLIEPDSLPNLVTNTGNVACGNTATQAAYKEGIKYAVQQFGSLNRNNLWMYLDAGHGGWLGWENNMLGWRNLLESFLLADLPKLRGFATNTAGYQQVGIACPTWDYCFPHNNNQNAPCCYDPCGLVNQYNPSINELNYALHMSHVFQGRVAGWTPYFLIDSGRNGVANMRNDCSNWCNIRDSGVGSIPTTRTGLDIVDALFWNKTPGESDGCTAILPDGSSCPRFDEDCGSQDSIGSRADEPRCPEAGQWFDYQIRQLAENANLYP
eukprot:Lithocolla_globosa_v1_NODE_3426_length_1673_cov_201.509271.p1 type:complete len:475 gc:universal NODE_3426_length_1673_cov_201.509271:1618-194(-)